MSGLGGKRLLKLLVRVGVKENEHGSVRDSQNWRPP